VSEESSGSETSASGLVERRCLSITVRGPWAHFRRVEGNIVKQTYHIMPRTTIAGLLAAILGIGRDKYYHLFTPAKSAIAIEPLGELRTMNMPENTLSTAEEHITRVPQHRRKLTIGLPDPTELRQQHNYEVLVDPAYRIDCWLADEDVYERLKRRFEAGESHYTPSLGLSEHLAEIDYAGEFEIERGPADGEVAIDSTVPEAIGSIVPTPEVSYGVERSPAHMETDDGGRTTTGFAAHAYDPDGGALLTSGVETNRVDGRTVMFR